VTIHVAVDSVDPKINVYDQNETLHKNFKSNKGTNLPNLLRLKPKC